MSKHKNELETTTLVQHHQLNRGQERVLELDGLVEQTHQNNAKQANELADLETQAERLHKRLGTNTKEAPPTEVKLDAAAQARIEAKMPRMAPLPILDIDPEESWSSTYKKVLSYAQTNQLDLDTPPLTQMLTATQVAQLERQFDARFGDVSFKPADWAAIGFATMLATLIDIAIVRIPKDMTFLGNSYKGSPVTKQIDQWARQVHTNNTNNAFLKWLGTLQDQLERWAKVTYDISSNNRKTGVDVDGLRPNMHRFMSPGHDPVLGLIFGVLDLLRGTCSLIDTGGRLNWIGNPAKQMSNPITALIKVIAHILSDLPTPAGIQPPMFTLFQHINAKSPFVLKENGGRVAINHVARWMYANGYTMGHFATMSLVPLVVELTLRIYYRANHFEGLYPLFPEQHVGHKAKLASMLAVAHTLTASTNIIKVAAYGWNPVALNWSQLLIMSKALIGSIRTNHKRERTIQDHLDQQIRVLWAQAGM